MENTHPLVIQQWVSAPLTIPSNRPADTPRWLRRLAEEA